MKQKSNMNIFDKPNPWSDMESPISGKGILSTGCSQKYVHSLYIGCDNQGRYIFLFKLPQGDMDLDSISMPKIKGCVTETFKYNEATFFCLALGDKKDWRLFKLLCQEIVSELENHERQENLYLLKILSGILNRCGRFFSKNKDPMTREDAVGLWGELYFLIKVVEPEMGICSAIESWKGPLGFPQDFSVNDTIVEVKTTEAANRHIVKISSADQLFFCTEQGFLHVLTISENSKEYGQSLNSLIEEIMSKCEEEKVEKSEFMAKLNLLNYSSSSPHSRKEYIVLQETFYKVCDKFPRLVPSGLPIGVEHVKYSINLNFCKQFKQTPDWISHE